MSRGPTRPSAAGDKSRSDDDDGIDYDKEYAVGDMPAHVAGDRELPSLPPDWVLALERDPRAIVAAKKRRKFEEVGLLKDGLRASEWTLIFHDTGLTTAETRELRAALGERAHVLRAKNTLIRRALADLNRPAGDVVGPTVLVFVVADPTVVAAELLRWQTRTSERLRIVSALTGDAIYGAEEVRLLAATPSRPELESKLAALVRGAISQPAVLGTQLLVRPVRLVLELQRKLEAGSR